MNPDIVSIKAKKYIGMTMEMSYADNKTHELWKSFMPRRNEINNTINNDLISLQIYEPGFFETFNPNRMFRKWTLREVSSLENIPEGMVSFLLQEGTYAVFSYRGLPAKAQPFFDYIFREWLPNSAYMLDDRPHFEVLGPKYRTDSPDSEEDVWIPVKLK
ncbi:GyrI-like domain-containing protein [Saccharicrinis sp. FJH54]|uniref:GyrI-like domain-containing protein n=1 Tax=Saccharicrinis sp. FJH54 TaxID=3344665 RepID=UPI0035D4BAA1